MQFEYYTVGYMLSQSHRKALPSEQRRGRCPSNISSLQSAASAGRAEWIVIIALLYILSSSQLCRLLRILKLKNSTAVRYCSRYGVSEHIVYTSTGAYISTPSGSVGQCKACLPGTPTYMQMAPTVRGAQLNKELRARTDTRFQAPVKGGQKQSSGSNQAQTTSQGAGQGFGGGTAATGSQTVANGSGSTHHGWHGQQSGGKNVGSGIIYSSSSPYGRLYPFHGSRTV